MSQTADIQFSVLAADKVYTNSLTPVTAIPWEDKWSSVLFESIPVNYSPDNMVWDFGDGTTYTGISAVHTYNWPGQYDVNLTIISDTGEPIVSTNTTTVTVYDFLPSQMQFRELKNVIDIPVGQLTNNIQIDFILSWQNYDPGLRPAPQCSTGEQRWSSPGKSPGTWICNDSNIDENPIYTFNLYASGSEAQPLNLERHNNNKYNHLRRDWSFHSSNSSLSSIPITSIDVTQYNTITGSTGDDNTYELLYHRYDITTNTFDQVPADTPGAVFTGLSGNISYYYRDDIVKCKDTRDLPVIITTELDSLKLPDSQTFKKHNLPAVKYSNIKPLITSNIKTRVNTPHKLAITSNGLNDFNINKNKWVNNEIMFTVSIQDIIGFNILDSSIFEYNFDIKLISSTGEEVTGYVITTIDDHSTGFYQGTLNCPVTSENVYLSGSLEFTQTSGYTTDAIAGWLHTHRPLSGTTAEYGKLYRYLHNDMFKYSSDLLDDTITHTITGKHAIIETNGIITGGTVLSAGNDLTSPPSFTIEDPTGTGGVVAAEYSPSLQQITDVIVLSGGINYISPTIIYYTNDGATDPVITLDIDDNKSTSIVGIGLQSDTESPCTWAFETGIAPRILKIAETGTIIKSIDISLLVDSPGTPIDIRLDSEKNPWICISNMFFKIDKDEYTVSNVAVLDVAPIKLETDSLDNIYVCYTDKICKYIKVIDTYQYISVFTLETGSIVDVLSHYNDCIYVLTSINTILKVNNDGMELLQSIDLEAGTYNELTTTIDGYIYTIQDQQYLIRVTDTAETLVDFEDTSRLTGLAGDSRGIIWITDDGHRKIWFVDVVPEEKPSNSSELYFLTLSYNASPNILEFNKINYTDYPDPDDNLGTDGHYIRSTGDWTGFEWLQKYGHIKSKRVTVTGSSNLFNLWPVTGRYNIRKFNEDHNHATTLKSYALQPWLNENSKLWDQTIDAAVGNSNDAPDTLGKQIFEKIANFTGNNNDVDDCNIDVLHNYTLFYNIDIQKYNLNYPPTMKRMMDICSIKHKRLYGEFDYTTETFDMYTDYTNKDTRENLGREIEFDTHILTPGDKIVAFEKFSKIYTPITLSYPTSGTLDYHGNRVNIGLDLSLVLNETETYPISSYSPFWEWGLIAPDTATNSDIQNYYSFFTFNNSVTNNQVEGVINWEDEQTTLIPTLSTYNEWSAEDNQLDNMLEHQLRVGLNMFLQPTLQDDENTLYYAEPTRTKIVTWNSTIGSTALVTLEGAPDAFIVYNDSGRLVWDYQGPTKHIFTYASETILRVIGEYIYAITFDGYSSIKFSISAIPTPVISLDESCIAEIFLTLNVIDDWVVHRGILEPNFLSSNILRKLFDTMNTSIKQELPSIETDTVYEVQLTGKGTVQFEGTGGYKWSTASSQDSESLDNETVDITFIDRVPTHIKIILNSADDNVGGISVRGKSTKDDIIRNGDFDSITSTQYSLNEWRSASSTPGFIPLNSLGWLNGFNESEIYTIFDSATEPTTLLPFSEQERDKNIFNFA